MGWKARSRIWRHQENISSLLCKIIDYTLLPEEAKLSQVSNIKMHKQISRLYYDLMVFPFPDFKTHSHPTPIPKEMLNIVSLMSLFHFL